MYTAEEKVTLSPHHWIEINTTGKTARMTIFNNYGDVPEESVTHLDRSEVIELIEKLAKVAEQLPK